MSTTAFPGLRNAGLRLAQLVLGALVLAWSFGLARAQPAAGAEDLGDPSLISDPDAVWTMPVEQRGRVHACRFEGRINFIDEAWNNLWIEGASGPRYISLDGRDLGLRSGQRVVIAGTYVPARGLDGDTLTMTVLEDDAPTEPVSIAGRFGDIAAFDRRVVVAEAYVDDQQLIDATHLRLYLIIQDRPAIGWMPPNDPASVPDLRRKFVRVQALYSGRLDPTGTESTVELWIPGERDLQVVGTIEDAAQFEIAAVPVGRISEVTRGATARVRGRLQRREVGEAIVVRDDTGEITVLTLQRERLPLGTEVEAVGRVAVSGARWQLESALFRRVASGDAAKPGAGPDVAVLRRIEHVRQLNRIQAGEGRAVDIVGSVVWSMPGSDFFYLHDLSGGVRVSRHDGISEPPLQKSVRVVGRSRAGRAGPEVVADEVIDIGTMAHPKPAYITVEQARAGTEDGQWVGLRGFLREVISEGDWRWIHVTSPDGEFVAHLQSPVTFVATPGSLIRVHGVCESTFDPAGRVSGTMLRVPFLHDITIEEDAPDDLFDLPLQSVDGLRQLHALRPMVRARVTGTVLAANPGEGLVLQQGATAMRVLTRGTVESSPGHRIEAVGIVGRAGARVVLRDAVVRTTGSGPTAEPVAVSAKSVLDRDLDERLVRIRATIADVTRQPGRLRLTLHDDEFYFESVLEGASAAAAGSGLEAGAVVDVVGLYRIEFDDAREPRAFHLRLRSPTDLALVRAARFWTVKRLFAVSGVLTGALLLAGSAAVLLRRRVAEQTAEIRRQMERQAGLEAELERAHRFKALGLLAGGLAHDFNNLLTSIMGNASVALFDKEVARRAGDCLRDIEDSAGRAHQLTQQLVTFAEGGDPIVEHADLVAMVHDIVRRVLTGARSRVEMAFPADLWPVQVDRGQMARALENILKRGRSDGGTPGRVVAIRAQNRAVASGESPTLAAGRYVDLEMRGCGGPVSADKLRIFFDPYATSTSDSDRFSMAIVYSILKRHQGSVSIESSDVEGCIFRLMIPAAEVHPAPVPTAQEPAAASAGRPLQGARVLLMDDEEAIRRLGERCLRHLGCEVQVAADGGECVRIYQAAMQSGRRFDVVILDLTVPGGLGGREAIEALRSLDPAVRAVVSSGYSNDPVMARFREHGFVAVVPKPYSVDVLTTTLQRVVAGA